MRTLIVKTGSDDPWMDGGSRPGPLLAMLDAQDYDRVLLLGTEADAVLVERLGDRLVLSEELDAGCIPVQGELDLLAHRFTESELGAAQLWLSGEGREARILCCRADAYRREGLAAMRESWFIPDVEVPGELREPAVAYHAPPGLEAVIKDLGLFGEDPGFRRLLSAAGQIAPHPVPVLIHGETGTGKELIARLVHRLSGKPKRKFVAVNCGALPATLAESILFGHVKGAFTGAVSDQRGKFERADGGTLFLDELGDLPANLQVKLLRVLQEGVVEPVGAEQGREVDVRIICATHRDIKAMVEAGDFREDLYYRLSLGTLELPPLRERRDDIPLIAKGIAARLYPHRFLGMKALRFLAQQDWPGNVRDLENVIGRSFIWSEARTLAPEDIQLDAPQPTSTIEEFLPEMGEDFSLDDFLAEMRRRLIFSALERTGHNKSAAARMLGVSPQAVSKFLRSVE